MNTATQWTSTPIFDTALAVVRDEKNYEICTALIEDGERICIAMNAHSKMFSALSTTEIELMTLIPRLTPAVRANIAELLRVVRAAQGKVKL